MKNHFTFFVKQFTRHHNLDIVSQQTITKPSRLTKPMTYTNSEIKGHVYKVHVMPRHRYIVNYKDQYIEIIAV